MSSEHWLLYLAAAIGLSLTPGPNGLLALTHGARFGWRPAVFTVLGGALGFLVLIAASLAGLGALLAASEQAFALAKSVGAAYLVYLGVRIWRSPPAIVFVDGDRRAQDADGLRLFRQGLLVAVSNPKALIFFTAFLPQFMVAGMSFVAHLAVLGGTFVVVEIVYELTLARLAHRISPRLARYGHGFNRAAGAAFVGLGAALLAARR